MPDDFSPNGVTRTLQAIAIIDDDALVRGAMKNLVEALGYEASSFSSAASFLATDLKLIDLVISDLQMPGMNGLELQARLNECAPALPFVVMTAFPQERVRRRALDSGARAFLEKPCAADAVVDVITALVGPPRQVS